MLKARLSSLEGLAESIASEYTEVDGSFVLQVEADGNLELVDSGEYKGTISKLRKERDDANGKIKALPKDMTVETLLASHTKLGELGDLDELESLDEKLAARQAQLETKFASDEARLKEKHANDLATVVRSNETLTGQLHNEIIRGTALKSIAASSGVPELLLPVVMAATKAVVDEHTGQLVAKVVDAKGEIRLSPKSGSSSDMTIDEMVLEMRDSDTYSRAFDGDRAGGGGTQTPHRKNASGNHTISNADAKNPAKYQSAKAQAEKAGATLVLSD